MSAELAKTAGVSIRDVIDGWLLDFPAAEQYSGAFVMAVGRFTLGVVLLFAAAVEAIMMMLALVLHMRNARLLEFIEKTRS